MDIKSRADNDSQPIDQPVKDSNQRSGKLLFLASRLCSLLGALLAGESVFQRAHYHRNTPLIFVALAFLVIGLTGKNKYRPYVTEMELAIGKKIYWFGLGAVVMFLLIRSNLNR